MRAVLLLALVMSVAFAAPSVRSCARHCGDDIAHRCASNGVTYANECLFRVAQCNDPSLRVVSMGVCAPKTQEECEKGCTREYMPVCGSDGLTYANKCLFDNAKRCKYNGQLSITKHGACD